MKRYYFTVICVMMGWVGGAPAFAQFPADSINETETEVIPYTLPDPLMMPDGKRVANIAQWETVQRPYLYHLFEQYEYGRYPDQAISIRYTIRETSDHALGNTATRKQVRIFLTPADSSVYIDVLMYLPKGVQGAIPVFLGLNFYGNATIQADPHIFLSKKPAYRKFEQPNEASDRGTHASRWPVQTIIDNGFGVVTACFSDLELDKKDGWKTGIRTTLQNDLKIRPEEWSAMGAWAWGLSRIMDFLETDKAVNAQKVAVLGLSRLGKTALWAGASDQRFSIVISNESGESGAALARRWFGETLKKINTSFPWWFVSAHQQFNERVFDLPMDQHELLALIAPRPLYVASAAGDLWSDPRGEFLGAWHAGEVYRLYGKKGIGTNQMPPVNQPVGHTIRYHIRTGKHDITAYDWQQYIHFAKAQWNIE